MTREQVLNLIKERGAFEVGNAIANLYPQLWEGWDLTDWRTATTSGALYIYRMGEGNVVKDAILCVNALEAKRKEWETLAYASTDGHPEVVTVLMKEEWFRNPPPVVRAALADAQEDDEL